MKTKIILFLVLTGFALNAVPAWKATAAKAIITPEKNLWMAGYASRKITAKGKLQDLFAKALVVEDETGARVAIITLDLIDVPKPLRVTVENEVQEKFKLAAIAPPAKRLAHAQRANDTHRATHWEKQKRAGNLRCHPG